MTDFPITGGDLLTIVAILSSAGAAVWRISTVLGHFENRIVELERDRYPLSVASENALRMAIENPGMRVPDPRDPNRVIHVTAIRTELS